MHRADIFIRKLDRLYPYRIDTPLEEDRYCSNNRFLDRGKVGINCKNIDLICIMVNVYSVYLDVQQVAACCRDRGRHNCAVQRYGSIFRF